MSSATITSPNAAHTVQVWLSSGSSGLGDMSSCLTPAESRLAERLNCRSRRRSFELARWLGKQAVSECVNSRGEEPGRIEILSEDSTGVTSRPIVFVNGIRSDVTISITHTDQTAAVGATDCDRTIGLDLARIQPTASGFEDVWMTDTERLQIAHSENSALTATMNWSAREAAFKATGIEDEFRPARWSVIFNGDQADCFYQGQRQTVLLSFFRVSSNLLLTVASDGANVTFRCV